MDLHLHGLFSVNCGQLCRRNLCFCILYKACVKRCHSLHAFHNKKLLILLIILFFDCFIVFVQTSLISKHLLNVTQTAEYRIRFHFLEFMVPGFYYINHVYLSYQSKDVTHWVCLGIPRLYCVECVTSPR